MTLRSVSVGFHFPKFVPHLVDKKEASTFLVYLYIQDSYKQIIHVYDVVIVYNYVIVFLSSENI